VLDVPLRRRRIDRVVADVLGRDAGAVADELATGARGVVG
jgi:hypothetical protein